MLMNPVKHAVLDAVRSFLGMIIACSNAFLIPIHGVKSPCSALWDHGKGLLGAWAPPSRCYTESHHRHYQELARLRHARVAGLVPDNRELVDNCVDTIVAWYSENHYQELVSGYSGYMNRIHKQVRERQAQYWNQEDA